MRIKAVFLDSDNALHIKDFDSDNKNIILEYAKNNNFFLKEFFKTQVKESEFLQITIRDKYILFFTWQLSVLVNAGIHLNTSLKSVLRQTKNRNLKTVIIEIIADLENGMLFSQSIKKFSKIFDAVYIASVEAGENIGQLGKVFAELSLFIEKKIELKNRLKTMLTYPLILSTIAFIGINVLVIFIMPKFNNLFMSFKIKSQLTLFFVRLGFIIQNYLIPFFLITVALIIIIYLVLKFSRKQKYIDIVKKKIPLLGEIYKKIQLCFFLYNLKLLISNKISVSDAVRISAGSVKDSMFASELLKCADKIENGLTLSESLSQTGEAPETVITMIESGEESASLPEMLNKIYVYYVQEIEFTVSRIMTVLEPLILVILGVIVCFIAVSVFLPVTEFINSLHRR